MLDDVKNQGIDYYIIVGDYCKQNDYRYKNTVGWSSNRKYMVKTKKEKRIKSMGKINNTEYVKEQYQKPDNLNTRISIHDKYSTNKMGLPNWYFSIYEINDGMKVLELGCGTGSMWLEHKDIMTRCSQIILSDLSAGMVETAKENVGVVQNVTYEVIDIQNIPYDDNYFDIVIANYMLYHVPDINTAISEVARVLKSGGYFYAGTTGEKGLMETIVKILDMDFVYENIFSLENGMQKIAPYFRTVEIKRYIDSLEVTDIDDLLEYIYSGITFKNACRLSREEVREKLVSHMKNGVLVLPKEPGMFVAVK